MLVTVEKRISINELMMDPWLFPQNAVSKPKSQQFLSLQLVDKFTRYKQCGKFKKSILFYIASQLSEKEISELRKIFVLLDEDKDGRLNYKEFEQGFELLTIKTIPKETIKNVFDSIDLSKKGSIDYNGKFKIIIY